MKNKAGDKKRSLSNNKINKETREKETSLINMKEDSIKEFHKG